MYVACLSFAGAHGVAWGRFSVSICFKQLHAQCMSLACILQEHTVWHEALSRAVFEEDEALQEKRMLEWVGVWVYDGYCI